MLEVYLGWDSEGHVGGGMWETGTMGKATFKGLVTCHEVAAESKSPWRAGWLSSWFLTIWWCLCDANHQMCNLLIYKLHIFVYLVFFFSFLRTESDFMVQAGFKLVSPASVSWVMGSQSRTTILNCLPPLPAHAHFQTWFLCVALAGLEHNT